MIFTSRNAFSSCFLTKSQLLSISYNVSLVSFSRWALLGMSNFLPKRTLVMLSSYFLQISTICEIVGDVFPVKAVSRYCLDVSFFISCCSSFNFLALISDDISCILKYLFKSFFECLDTPHNDFIEFLICVFNNDSNVLVVFDSSMPYNNLDTRMLFDIDEIVPGCTHLIPDEMRNDVVAQRSDIRE